MNAQLQTAPPYDLDTLFSISDVDNVVILNQAVNEIIRSQNTPLLFDPEKAKIGLLYEGEPLVSWLLRASALVDDQIMAEACAVAASTDVTVVDVLVNSGRVSQSDMRAAFDAESLVKEGLIYRGFAASALKYACSYYVDFSTALNDLDLIPDNPFAANKLVVLLEKIGFIDADDLLACRRKSLARGITVGWSLVKNSVIEQQLLKVLLEGLIAVERGRVGMDTFVASSILAVCRHDNAPLSPEAKLISELGLVTLDRAFGNLLVASGFLTIDEVLYCLEVALSESRSVDSVLSLFQLVDPLIFDGACQLARLLTDGEITPRQCTVFLERLKSTGLSLSDLLNDATRDHPVVIQANLALVSPGV